MDVVFVLDRSGSMRSDFAGLEDQPRERWKWTQLQESLADVFTALDPAVRIGAKFYPDEIDTPAPSPLQTCALAPGLDVPISEYSRSEVIREFDRTNPSGGTPTAAAIIAAAEALEGSSASFRYVVLATDGVPNCNSDIAATECVCTGTSDICDSRTGTSLGCLDDDGTVGAVERTLNTGIPTFVIGLDDDSHAFNLEVLDRMAMAGGRPREGEHSFYAVRSQQQLHAAIDEIATSISRCSFVVPTAFSRAANRQIEIDGQAVAEDSVNGWSWSAGDEGRLILNGDACAREAAGGHVRGILLECADDSGRPTQRAAGGT